MSVNSALHLSQHPTANEIYMIMGWRQWADAGCISSGLPDYLISLTDAVKIGEIRDDGFYMFQIPGTHHLLRPVVSLKDGLSQRLETNKNEIYYAGNAEKGLVIFLGDEPHMNVERYVGAVFDLVETLKIRRVAAVGGVFGSMPYDTDRDISCIYSLPHLKEELADYAVRFSNYEGGATIGSYLVSRAAERKLEFLGFYGFVPAYDFSSSNFAEPHGLRIEHDFKAWYDLMRRLKHLFGLGLDLSSLEEQSHELLAAMEERLAQLEEEYPEADLSAFFEQLREEFTTQPFTLLDDMWVDELRDLFDDEDHPA